MHPTAETAPISQPEDDILARIKRIEEAVVPSKLESMVSRVGKIAAVISAVGGPIIGWNYAQVKKDDVTTCLLASQDKLDISAEKVNVAARTLTACNGQKACDDAFNNFKSAYEGTANIGSDMHACVEKMIPSSFSEVISGLRRAVGRIF